MIINILPSGGTRYLSGKDVKRFGSGQTSTSVGVCDGDSVSRGGSKFNIH